MRSLSMRSLAAFAHDVRAHSAPPAVQNALSQTLTDSLGVAIAGQRTPEHRRLVQVWPTSPGAASIWGRPAAVDVPSATMLNAIALCMLELDEGNKFARGHPGAHVLPVAMAAAEQLRASGTALLDAILAGYEVAARVARAFTPHAGLHPHGNWGAIGAAVALGRLHAFTPDRLAEAMDAAAGLALASPFSSALKGSFVRNTWVGAAGINGLTAVQLVRAELGSVDETAEGTYGSLLGALDEDELVRDLGTRWEISGGYYKRHSSCNYTHPPADAALAVRSDPRFAPDAITAVTVQTHALALPLSETRPATRLAAMFSIPHVVAVALTYGRCAPESFADDALHDPAIAGLRERVSVELDADIDADRPAQRGARVLVTLANGEQLSETVPNAIGDADHHPFTALDIDHKLSELIGDEALALVHSTVDALHAGEGAAPALARLSALSSPTKGTHR